MIPVAIYIQKTYGVKVYENDSYNKRIFPGMEMIRDALRRAGIETGTVDSGTVNQAKIILVPMISSFDWYSFIAERVTWKPGNYIVIVGGAGILNVRPFLEYADIFVLGRAEWFIVDLVNAALAGNRYESDSVIYADEFSMEKDYMIAQSPHLYQYPVELPNGVLWMEAASGCQHKCLFCGYTWQRKHQGQNQSHTGASRDIWPGSAEHTIMEMDLESDPAQWFEDSQTRIIVGLDGVTEKLRFAVNKQITDDMLRRFVYGICERKKVKPVSDLKFYVVCGYPGETPDDWRELVQNFVNWDNGAGPKTWESGLGINIQFSPFKPIPVSPAATWPVSLIDYREWVEDGRFKVAPYPGKYVVYQGAKYTVNFTHWVRGLSTILLWVLAERATESDAENFKRLVLTPKFWTLNRHAQVETLFHYFDMDKITGRYTWENLPTRNIKTYVPNKGLKKLSHLNERYINIESD